MQTCMGRVVQRHSPARLSRAKAKLMLKEGSAQGHPLTENQKGFFGLIAGGGRPSRKKGYRGG